MSGSLYQKAKEQAPTAAVDFETAITFVKEHARTSFVETVELHLNLGVDPGKSDQMVRGTVVLPGGAATQKRVAVFTTDVTQQAAATAAGAAIVGGEELVAQVVKEEKLEADIVIATPEMMPKIARAARILGPQGLMPNPKTGTVTPDPASAVKELAAGKLSFKMDQHGNIHEAIGKVDWEQTRLVDNAIAILEAVKKARPATTKGELIRSVTIASTMGPGIRVAV